MRDEHDVHVGTSKVGKSTVAGMVRAFCTRHGFEFAELAFADALKNAVAEAYGLRRDQYDTPETKEIEIPGLGYSFRNLLRLFGTEVVRKGLGLENRWCDIVLDQLRDREEASVDRVTRIIFGPEESPYVRWTLKNRLQRAVRTARLPPLPEKQSVKVTVISDMRFPVEYRAVKNRPGGCFVMQVQRRTEEKTASAPAVHSSEQNYASVMEPDVVLQNYGTLSELERRVEECLVTMLGEDAPSGTGVVSQSRGSS